MDEMERLKEDYRDRFADRPGTDEAGKYTEEDVPGDLQLTCIRCHRHINNIIDTQVYILDGIPGDRGICGKCVFELDVIAYEDEAVIEVDVDPEPEVAGE